MPAVRRSLARSAVALAAMVAPVVLHAQPTPAVSCPQATADGRHATMDHAAHMAAISACERARAALPTEAGQPVFAALAEVVRILDADPTTDWATVNLEALRQHLLDMDAVVMRAQVAQQPVEGGFTADVTGAGAVVGAIQRMVMDHARMMDQAPAYVARTERLPDGVRLTVTVEGPPDPRSVARLRGLGVAGFLTEGSHHLRHHLALARGDRNPHRH